jgi:ubiquinone biosynthesis monooxygenase Coq7
MQHPRACRFVSQNDGNLSYKSRPWADHYTLPMDRFIGALDSALRTLFATPRATRPCPVVPADDTHLGAQERSHAAALMRVNHVGEVCAQALYTAQAMSTADPALKARMEQAAREETDHLAWTKARLDELGARPSLLNPLWYAGAFGLGLVAGRFGDPVSQGFVIETERQVEAHLQSHLERLPPGDHASRAIVAQMKDDERAHAEAAQRAGGIELPPPVKFAMRAAAKVMTTTAHYL